MSFSFFVAVVPKNSPRVGTEKKKERKKSYREGVLERGDQKEMASETEEGTEAVLNRRQKKSTN